MGSPARSPPPPGTGGSSFSVVLLANMGKMDWSRWLIGVSKYDEQCRLCGSPIPAGETLAVEEAVMEPECVGCFWEYARSLTKKARPRARPKPKGAVMPWQKVTGGQGSDHGGENIPNNQIQKWSNMTVLEGRLITTRQGKFGELMVFNDDKSGEVVYPLSAILKSRLESANTGRRLRIECLGKTPLKSGHQAWNFAVYEDA